MLVRKFQKRRSNLRYLFAICLIFSSCVGVSKSVFTELKPKANSCQTIEVVTGFLAAADFTLCWDNKTQIITAVVPGNSIPPAAILEEPLDTAIGTTLIIK